MIRKATNAGMRLSGPVATAVARWLLALLAASVVATAILRLQTFLYVPWEARRRGVETAYEMLASVSYWTEAAWSLVPLSLATFALSLPFAIVVSAFPEARGGKPRLGRYAVVGGICPIVWVALAAALLQPSETETYPRMDAADIIARPELGFLVIAGLFGGYCFGRMRMAFR
ncbi:hypothetical protein [Bosea sp. (in: a-proteobacteria)]|uniref:hypothetical protein n=1 Tax=Bosea sp. (in: a-proteobacteria) TaxID=1871050 RepID=UPI0025C62E25|nr:hypothetical protein [Bosea sp. (in: a-proteobacteria)]